MKGLAKAMVAVAVALGAACSGSDSKDGPSVEDCSRLRDHSLDLRLTAAPRPRGMDSAELERHKATLVASSGPAYVDQCRSLRTDEEVACGLAATTLDAFRSCFPQVTER
jgi:hypothetical protein